MEFLKKCKGYSPARRNGLVKKCNLKFSPQTVYSHYRPLAVFIKARQKKRFIPILTRMEARIVKFENFLLWRQGD